MYVTVQIFEKEKDKELKRIIGNIIIMGGPLGNRWKEQTGVVISYVLAYAFFEH